MQVVRLSKEEIKKLAIDEVRFQRGVRYFQSGAVSNVMWSGKTQTYRGTVTGNNPHIVSLTWKEDGSLSYSCNCPDYIKRNGACKHIIAMLLFVQDYMGRAEGKNRSGDEKKAFNILEYFSKQDFKEMYGETYDIRPIVTIPTIFKEKEDKAQVSITVGSSRMYKVQNLRKFLADYYDGTTIHLGKEFHFVHGEHRFSKRTRGFLEHLLDIYEIQEVLGKGAFTTNLFAKSEMSFSKNMLKRLLATLGKEKFTLVLKEKVYPDVTFVKGNPELGFYISAKEDEIMLDYNADYQMIPLASDGSLILYEDVVYEPDKKFIQNFLPFYSSLGKDREGLVFRGEDKQRFLDLVLPKINETMTIDVPKSLRENYIVEDLQTAIYLDKYKNHIKATVKFQYGAYEINPLASQIPEGIVIVRQKDKESLVMEYLESLQFVPYQDGFLLKDEEQIYQFITEGVTEMSERYPIFYSDDFRTITIKGTGTIRTGVKVNKESDLLEMDLEYEEVPKEELKELFHSLMLKKKYHRLRNGAFINLEDKEALEGKRLLEELHLDYSNYNEDHFEVPKYASMFLDEFLEDSEIILAKKEESFKQLISDISKKTPKRYNQPKGIEASLRKYQVTGYRWLKTLSENGLGGILADDMGLGKTLQSIVYMASFPEKCHLVVCPTSLVYNWQEEVATYVPHLKTVIVQGAPEVRQELIKNYENVNIIITSYPLLRRDFECYADVPIDTMFIDEAQFIKNPGSQNSKAVKKIHARCKFALTGTPIENSLTELWSIFDYILPGYLLSHRKFVEEYEKPIVRDENTDVLASLGKKIQPFILRRMKKDVLKELPDKLEKKMVTELTEKQRQLYLSFLANIREELHETIEQNGFEKSRMQILSALTRLRQICCHPSTFVENYDGDSGKLELLMDILPGMLENGHRILIFSQFTSMLSIISKRLEESDIRYYYLDGNTKPEERIDMVNTFNEGERQVFLISLKAGGTGLNLTGADTVIHFDPWWNPAVEDQATDRAYRIGQKNTVNVFRLLTKNTIEEKIFKLQEKKKDLSDSIIEAREVFINKLTKEEMEELLS